MKERLVVLRTRVAQWLTGPRAFFIAALCVAALHFALTFHVTRRAPLFSFPLSWVDFATHAEQTYRVTDALDQFGKPWL